MREPRLFIFNPATDFALAAGRNHYSPPAIIRKFARDMQLVQALVASPGDCILVADDFNPALYPSAGHLEAISSKDLSLLRHSELRELMRQDSVSDKIPFSITPWGWNHSLRIDLLGLGVSPSLIPSQEDIDSLRALSHRRTVIPFQKRLAALLPSMNVPEARELYSVEECMHLLSEYEEIYFKSPWSSSGRGVVSSASLTQEQLEQWTGGCIRRQGSVMGEKGWRRRADFATEWIIDRGKATFIGLSLFQTSQQGRYAGNSPLPQQEIEDYLKEISVEWSNEIIEAQRIGLEEIIAPHYSGPAGIDMLADESGRINPCVEINLRMTMGIISLGHLPPYRFPSA